MYLHEELLTYKFHGWHTYALLHAMIDAGCFTVFECQAIPCKRETRQFAKKGTRGQGDLLVIDHIDPRRNGGSNRTHNLRILHNSCNAGWREGITGTFHTEETKAVIRDKVRQAHADGKLKKIYTPERGANISAGHMRKSFEERSRAAKQSWATRRQKEQAKGEE